MGLANGPCRFRQWAIWTLPMGHVGPVDRLVDSTSELDKLRKKLFEFDGKHQLILDKFGIR